MISRLCLIAGLVWASLMFTSTAKRLSSHGGQFEHDTSSNNAHPIHSGLLNSESAPHPRHHKARGKASKDDARKHTDNASLLNLDVCDPILSTNDQSGTTGCTDEGDTIINVSKPDSTLYALAASYQGPNFFDAFTWETFDDPTHGRVNYVDVSTARARNLSFASEDTFVMRADAERVVQPGARGRDSVRIRSRDTWEEGVYVLDVAHMPTGCATWPAFWTVTKGQWPAGGEIDIIEGVNLATHNVATLHTAPKCDMNTANRTQRGRAVSTDCDTNVNSNQGCGTMFVRSDSYGAEFNKNGGGYYVMERTSQRVSVWCWGRNDSDIPDGIITAGGSPPETTQCSWRAGDNESSSPQHILNSPASAAKPLSYARDSDVLDTRFFSPRRISSLTDNVCALPKFSRPPSTSPRTMHGPTSAWGQPDAVFEFGAHCDYGAHFGPHSVVFDLTLCGDWAGTAFGNSGCGPSSCEAYVDNNPGAFTEAHWEINSLRIYVPDSDS